jgi:hypothetical protein
MRQLADMRGGGAARCRAHVRPRQHGQPRRHGGRLVRAALLRLLAAVPRHPAGRHRRHPPHRGAPPWGSEHSGPPLQADPSAHAIQCQAIARTLRSLCGTDRVSGATQSTTALPSHPVRAFNRRSAASRECRESRIRAGFHYRFSVNVGARMGNEVARKMVDTQLRRRQESTGSGNDRER